MKIDVYHNVYRERRAGYTEADFPAGMIDGWQGHHPVTLVATLELDAVALSTAYPEEAACEEVFRLFNVGDDPAFGEPDPRAVAYRAQRNRSLSKGDVVCLDDRFWLACASFGWERIGRPAQITVTTLSGTTPLSVPAATS